MDSIVGKRDSGEIADAMAGRQQQSRALPGVT
jgi:hypothetical protein